MLCQAQASSVQGTVLPSTVHWQVYHSAQDTLHNEVLMHPSMIGLGQCTLDMVTPLFVISALRNVIWVGSEAKLVRNETQICCSVCHCLRAWSAYMNALLSHGSEVRFAREVSAECQQEVGDQQTHQHDSSGAS
eukprot:2926500-Alexandrium_andersonii.AAC.1